jgi:hypothetical protein
MQLSDLCERGIRLDAGRLVERGRTATLVAHDRRRADRANRSTDAMRGFNDDVAILRVREPQQSGGVATVVAEVEIAVRELHLEPKLVLRARGDDTTLTSTSGSLTVDHPGRYALICTLVPPMAYSEFDVDLLVDVETSDGVRESIGRRAVAAVSGESESFELDVSDLPPDAEDLPLDEDESEEPLDAAWRLEMLEKIT